MEMVNDSDDIKNLSDNEIIGKPKLNNSEIIFSGSGNILYFEDGVVLSDTSIRFCGDNSIIYLSKSKFPYFLNLMILNNSIIFIGENNKFYPFVNISISNNQNLIIGCDCIIESNVTLGSMHDFELIDLNSKEKILNKNSIYVGDHVSICSHSFVSNGVEIGSGAILNSCTFVPDFSSLNSNTLYSGNPITSLRNNISYIIEDNYNDNIEFKYNNNETLSPEKINSVLNKVEGKKIILVLEEIFIKNKKHDRLSI